MASADVLPAPSHVPVFPLADSSIIDSTKRKRPEASVQQRLLDMAVANPPRITFEPEKHLAYQAPKKIWTMSEIGFDDKGISPNAVSEPFPLFTKEAIEQMRSEVLSQTVLDNCQYSSNLAHNQIRGMAPK
jgi:hypothetical protein